MSKPSTHGELQSRFCFPTGDVAVVLVVSLRCREVGCEGKSSS